MSKNSHRYRKVVLDVYFEKLCIRIILSLRSNSVDESIEYKCTQKVMEVFQTFYKLDDHGHRNR